MLSSAEHFVGFFSSDITEAMAILYRVQLAIEVGFSPFCCNSDDASIVHQLSSKSNSCSNVGLVVDNILMLLNFVPIFSVSFVLRSANMVAHDLAKLALRLAFVCVSFLIENVPHCIASLISKNIGDSL
ncbi:hypothetical protein ACOSQ3_005285 [Xanthoceras sorbifolium]